MGSELARGWLSENSASKKAKKKARGRKSRAEWGNNCIAIGKEFGWLDFGEFKILATLNPEKEFERMSWWMVNGCRCKCSTSNSSINKKLERGISISKSESQGRCHHHHEGQSAGVGVSSKCV